MSQGSIGTLRIFEDFLSFGDADVEEVAIADGAPERIGQVTVGGNDDALTLAATVDEPGGVLSITNDSGTGDLGWAMYCSPFVPNDGGVAFEVRLKFTDISETNFFIGFVETFPNTDPDNIVPYTISGTTISVVNFGVTAGVFCDHNADNEDFYFAAAQDTVAASGIDLTNPATGGGSAGADLSGTGGNNEWIVFRVEIEDDGTAYGYVGSSLNNATSTGFRLIGQTDRGALDNTAVVFPVVLVDNNGSSAMTTEVDYFMAKGGRNWAV